MDSHIEVDECPICHSKIWVKLVPAHVSQLPDEIWTCRCRIVYPDAFRRSGELGYAHGARSRRRSLIHR